MPSSKFTNFGFSNLFSFPWSKQMLLPGADFTKQLQQNGLALPAKQKAQRKPALLKPKHDMFESRTTLQASRRIS
jgi:hypothetical protein